MNKYGAKKTIIDGITFDSKRESQHYVHLKIREKAGEIYNLELQPVYQIIIGDMKICKVIPDFRYVESNVTVVEDVKGMDTAISRLKRKLVKAVHGVDIVIIK